MDETEAFNQYNTLYDKHCELTACYKSLQAENAKLKEERDEWRNKCIMAEDDANYYHAIFDGSWPTAIETLEARLKALKE
jgi:hypothetical protein